MGTTIENVIEDADALMEHIKYWMDCTNNKSAEHQLLVQKADELIEELCKYMRDAQPAQSLEPEVTP